MSKVFGSYTSGTTVSPWGLRSQLSDRHLAEDAAQEALAVTCRKLHTLRNGAGFPSWLATIVRRTAVRMRRSQKNGQPLAEEPIAPPNEASSQTAIRVNEAIAGLPRSAREIVQLHYFSGLSYEEISRTLQITPQAVHGRLQRAQRASPRSFRFPKSEIIEMSEVRKSKLDDALRQALGSAPGGDFAAWRAEHTDSIAFLNPTVTAKYHWRRRFLIRMASSAVAAALVLLAGIWLFVSQEQSFAQTVHEINKAETITCEIVWYNRMWSEDGKRSWLNKGPRWERSFLAPNRFRDVRYDGEGNISTIDVEDTVARKVLHLSMKDKIAMVKNEPSGQFGNGGNPFASLAKLLEREPIEFAGQREVDGVKANVFRYRKEFSDGGHDTTDFWLDIKTKRLMGYCDTPEDKPFDPDTDADRNNAPEKRISKGTIAGVITHNIVFDAQLDPSLFSLTPPEGFKIIEPKVRPKVTEESLIKWLRASARANGNQFLDTEPKSFRQWMTKLNAKSKNDRSKAEQDFLELVHSNVLDGNINLLSRFEEDVAQPRTFKYLGKGATLGDHERIICYYESKNSSTYRAIYGDLSAKEVRPDELPLPVEK